MTEQHLEILAVLSEDSPTIDVLAEWLGRNPRNEVSDLINKSAVYQTHDTHKLMITRGGRFLLDDSGFRSSGLEAA